MNCIFELDIGGNRGFLGFLGFIVLLYVNTLSMTSNVTQIIRKKHPFQNGIK